MMPMYAAGVQSFISAWVESTAYVVVKSFEGESCRIAVKEALGVGICEAW